MSSSHTSGDDSQNRTSSEEVSVSPAASPPLQWTTDEEDHIPLAQRQVAARALAIVPPPQRSPDAGDRIPLAQRLIAARVPASGGRARAGPSSRAEAESPEGASSTITGPDLARIRERFQIPRDIGLFLPTPDDRVISSRPGRVAVYEICLRVGLRPPFHPFFINLLDYYSLTPTQLVPNSIRVICAFIILCFRLEIPPRIPLFRNFYILRAQKGWWLFQPRPGRTLKITLPSSIKGWKSRFFFADLPQVKPQWGKPDLRGNAGPSVQPGDREALGKLMSTENHRYTRLLTEENLLTAGVVTHMAMRIPTQKLMKAATKKRAREEPSTGQRAPIPKRPVTRASQPLAPGVPPAAPEIDLTADTPPEATVTVRTSGERTAAEKLVATRGLSPEEPTTTAVPGSSTLGGLSPEEAPKDWGEGPSGAISPHRDQAPEHSPSIEPGNGGDIEGRRTKPGPARAPFQIDGHWAEQALSHAFAPEILEELGQLNLNAFFRESCVTLVRMVNSLRTAKEVIHEERVLMREAQKEANEARARAAAAEGALESAKTDRAAEIRAAECRADVEANRFRAVFSQLAIAESAVVARDIHISDLTKALEAAERRAAEAAEEAKAAVEKVRAAEEKISQVQEAEKVAVAALAAEQGARAVEVESAAASGAAKAVEEYKGSERFTDDLAEASAEVFLQGFECGKEKIARVFNLPEALGIELDQSSNSDEEAAPTPP